MLKLLCVCFHCFPGKPFSLCLHLLNHACWDIFPACTWNYFFSCLDSYNFLTNRLEGVSGKADDGQCYQEGNYKPVGQIAWALLLGLALPVHHTIVQVEEEGQKIECRRAFGKMVEASPLRSWERKNS